MRIRTIKPEFWQSESLSRISREARLLFIGLFSACDDSGKTRAASRFLASLLFPYDDDAPKAIEGWLKELEKEGCIRRYVVDGNTYLDIPKWRDHQKIDKPSASKLPPFAEDSRPFAEPSRTVVIGSGIRDQGTGTIAPAGAVAKESERDMIFEALCAATGTEIASLTKSGRGAINGALRDIRAASPQVTAEEIQSRARAYARKFPSAALTAPALAKHWASCGSTAGTESMAEFVERMNRPIPAGFTR
jgi:hypothetical protein